MQYVIPAKLIPSERGERESTIVAALDCNLTLSSWSSNKSRFCGDQTIQNGVDPIKWSYAGNIPVRRAESLQGI